ncbi:hypothetical protein QWJ34_04505 [Saccharibacillus sp. CPCC 101409]|uniref:hypothetical protein n=1 Tax=Saccharibacillus sp. CPCC 101409 TaxID=3058041 RepID=UPI002673BA6F|nr:hypothetical protein [Saccharibacillus sp. CPCC 101409]MDO3409015.1 hypothetical protein [Saccharibacillus sp. CPCC 101409]
MSKHIQAYFRTESEAEGARMSLMTFVTEQLEVGELQEAFGRRGASTGRVIVPLVPLAGTTNAGFTGGAAASGGAGSMIGDQAVPVPAPGATGDLGSQPVDKDDVADVNENASDAELRDLKYTLSAKVSDEDYPAVVRKLRNNNGYVHVYE